MIYLYKPLVLLGFNQGWVLSYDAAARAVSMCARGLLLKLAQLPVSILYALMISIKRGLEYMSPINTGLE